MVRLEVFPLSTTFSLAHFDSRSHLVEMAPYLAHLLSTNAIPSTSETQSLLKTLQEKNEKYLKESEEKLKDSKDNLGETEVSDALRDKASYLAKIGEKVRLHVTIPWSYRRLKPLFL